MSRQECLLHLFKLLFEVSLERINHPRQNTLYLLPRPETARRHCLLCACGDAKADRSSPSNASRIPLTSAKNGASLYHSDNAIECRRSLRRTSTKDVPLLLPRFRDIVKLGNVVVERSAERQWNEVNKAIGPRSVRRDRVHPPPETNRHRCNDTENSCLRHSSNSC